MEGWPFAFSQGYGRLYFTLLCQVSTSTNFSTWPQHISEGWTLTGSQGYGQPRFTRMDTFLSGFNFYWIEHMTTTNLGRMDVCILTRLWRTVLHKDGHFSARFQFLLISVNDNSMIQKDGHLQAHKAMDNPASQGWTLSFQVSTFTELRTWPQQVSEGWTFAGSQGYGQHSFTRMDTFLPGFNF